MLVGDLIFRFFDPLCGTLIFCPFFCGLLCYCRACFTCFLLHNRRHSRSIIKPRSVILLYNRLGATTPWWTLRFRFSILCVVQGSPVHSSVDYFPHEHLTDVDYFPHEHHPQKRELMLELNNTTTAVCLTLSYYCGHPTQIRVMLMVGIAPITTVVCSIYSLLHDTGLTGAT